MNILLIPNPRSKTQNKQTPTQHSLCPNLIPQRIPTIPHPPSKHLLHPPKPSHIRTALPRPILRKLQIRPQRDQLAFLYALVLEIAVMFIRNFACRAYDEVGGEEGVLVFGLGHEIGKEDHVRYLRVRSDQSHYTIYLSEAAVHGSCIYPASRKWVSKWVLIR
jgi:hypothetical protein